MCQGQALNNMLVQEPLHAAIWHCLNHYDLNDATFLAERLFSEVHTEESLFLLATCYYRSGKLSEALDVLKVNGTRSQKNKFLLAKCCFDLNKYSEAEVILKGENSDPRKDVSMEEMSTEFGDAAPFAFQLLGAICGRTERIRNAIEYERKALKLNPFLWNAFESLCQRGDYPDPSKVFTVASLESFNYCHGVNPILSVVNTANHKSTSFVSSSHFQQTPVSQSGVTITTSTPNLNNATPQHPQTLVTPQHPQTYAKHPQETETPIPDAPQPMDTINESTPFEHETPSSNTSNVPFRFSLSGVAPLNCSSVESDVEISKPHKRLMPPNFSRKLKNFTPECSIESKPNQDSIYSSSPTFGMLPKTFLGDGKVALQLNFSSPSLSVLSQTPENNSDSVITNAPQKQKKVSKENPLKPSVFGQSSNMPNITPTSTANQAVRRSSRLFGSTQSSVKENSKAPTKKGRVQNSPSRNTKSKTRLALTNSQQQQQVQQNQQQQNSQLTISDAEKLSDDSNGLKKPLINVQVNLSAHALDIQKQSVEGLMCFLRQLGAGFIELKKYNSSRAIEIFESLPTQHRKSGWIRGLIGKAFFELADYKSAKRVFKELREKESHRMEFMEYFSTALWHLQEDVELSALAQDLIKVNKNAPEAWCAAGNCFSHLKEHENAIKFFKRAVDVDFTFAYAHTLLGHEYVLIEELDQALSCFRTALRMDPRHYNAWYGIGLTYYKQERFPLAEIYFRKALAINSRNPILMCHIAVVQHAMQKTEKALETLNVALKQAPKNSLCKFERATILFAAERYQEALEELNELKILVPKESPVYFLLGKVHNKLNNTHLALTHYAWAIDLDPKGAANSQIKDVLDPTLNRVQEEVNSGERAQEEREEMMQIDMQDMSDSFNPQGGASTSQESLDATSTSVGYNRPGHFSPSVSQAGQGTSVSNSQPSESLGNSDIPVTPPPFGSSQAGNIDDSL